MAKSPVAVDVEEVAGKCILQGTSYIFRHHPAVNIFKLVLNLIGGVMLSVLASSAINRGFKPWSSQIKDYKIGICCFSDKHAALRRKSKYWLAWNQNSIFLSGPQHFFLSR